MRPDQRQNKRETTQNVLRTIIAKMRTIIVIINDEGVCLIFRS